MPNETPTRERTGIDEDGAVDEIVRNTVSHLEMMHDTEAMLDFGNDCEDRFWIHAALLNGHPVLVVRPESGDGVDAILAKRIELRQASGQPLHDADEDGVEDSYFIVRRSFPPVESDDAAISSPTTSTGADDE